jgi:predicted GNAT family N-acyltransferase
MVLYIKKYSDLTIPEINQITDLIISGGEVDERLIVEGLGNSEHIAFFESNNNIIATATIKIPRESYKTKIFKKSCLTIDSNDYIFELGYIVVNNEFRNNKLASKMCQNLCSLIQGNLFATTRETNFHMQNILLSNSFRKVGNSYLNKRKTELLQLYIRPNKIDLDRKVI